MLVKRRFFIQQWLVVGAMTLVMTGFYGTQNSFSVFLKPMLVEFGWTRAMASGGMSIVGIVSALSGVIMGRLTDKYGARILIGIGGLLGGAGCLLMYWANSLWQFYLFFGVMVGICVASCWTPGIATVSRWFVEKRGLALGITMIGITLGNMLLPPFSTYFIIGRGWRFAYIALAIIVWAVTIPVMLILGRSPAQDIGSRRDVTSKADKMKDKAAAQAQPREWTATEAAKTVPFWMLIVTGFVAATGYYFVVVHIVAYATDLEIASTSAALIMTFLGGATIPGRLLILPIAAGIGSRFALLILFALQALALFLLTRATSLWAFFVLASIFGFGFGAATLIRTSMIPEFFGLKSVGVLVGIIHVAWDVGAVCGPFLAGYVFDTSGSYDIAFFAAGLLMVVAMMATYYLKDPGEQSISSR